MSTVICQGLQPCLDSQLIETTTTLKLKIVEDQPKSPTPTFPLLENNHHSPKKIFLDERVEFSKPFPPLRLSDKSLEICTENLGSESGSDTPESSIFPFDFESEKMPFDNEQKNLNFRPLREMKKANPREFPPPLTTISGSDSLRVRTHREAGRLVMKAVNTPTFGSYFQAERSQGRLRLTIFKNYEPKFDPMANESENVCNVEIQEDNEEDQEEEDDDENEIYEEGDDEEEEEEYDQCEGGDSDEYYVREDWDANRKDVGVEMGIEKFQRPSRCKEGRHGDKGLCHWEAIWVATS